MKTVSDLVLVDAATAGSLVGGQRRVRVSNFVTVQSLSTFAVASAVLASLWQLSRMLFGPWADSDWTVVALCALYGAWQFAISAAGLRRMRHIDFVSAAVIAVVNAAMLAAAVIGLVDSTRVR